MPDHINATPQAREAYAERKAAAARQYRAVLDEKRRESNARFVGVVVFLSVLTFGAVSAFLS